jgi:RNase H-like domain found in reverse transcriptase
LAPVKRKYPRWVHWYMDDILTATPGDQKLHDEIVHWILRIFEENNPYLKPKKCRFDQEEVDFLGYVIKKGEICVDPSKQHGLEEWPRRLNNVTEVQRTLGLLGYQRQFIPNFAKVAHPLHELTKKNVKFEWTEEHTQALDTLIKAVTSDPVLLQPNMEKPFTLEVDASQYASGAILYQEDNESRLRPVGYYSKTFNSAERNYDIYDRELLAIVRGLLWKEHLLTSSPHKITVVTGHLNLTYYWEARKIN